MDLEKMWVCLHSIQLKFNLSTAQVEVTVTNENPSASDMIFPHSKWSGKLHELEKKAGLGIRDMMKALRDTELNGGCASSQGNMNSAQGDSIRDDDEDGWASDTSDIHDGNGPRPSGSGKKVSGVYPHPHHGHHKSRRRPSIRRGHAGDVAGKIGEKEAVEELRGRDNRPSSSRSTAASVTFAGGTTYSKSRPGTADTFLSRSSVGESSLRNLRVESLRTLHSVPPTRENSPSRSVRFDVGSSSGRKNLPDFVDTKENTNATSPLSSPLASAQASRSPSPVPAYQKQP